MYDLGKEPEIRECNCSKLSMCFMLPTCLQLRVKDMTRQLSTAMIARSLKLEYLLKNACKPMLEERPKALQADKGLLLSAGNQFQASPLDPATKCLNSCP